MDLIKTIETIIRSPSIERYSIGITVDSKRRRSTYKNFKPTWQYFVVLEQGLSARNALKLEKKLFEQIQGNKGSILFKKYRGDTKYDSHTPSLGGLSLDNDKMYDLYVAWGNKGDN